MLQYHLNNDIEASSRNCTFIEKSCSWIAYHFSIKGKKVIDFGCGPGLYTTRLAQKGARFWHYLVFSKEQMLEQFKTQRLLLVALKKRDNKTSRRVAEEHIHSYMGILEEPINLR